MSEKIKAIISSVYLTAIIVVISFGCMTSEFIRDLILVIAMLASIPIFLLGIYLSCEYLYWYVKEKL